MNLQEVYTSPFWVRLVLVLLTALAVLKLGSEFYRLVLDDGNIAAIDLAMRHLEIQQWFAGEPVYGVNPNAVYPPASQLLFWPFAGWKSFQFVRCLWAVVSVGCLVWLVLLLKHECKPSSMAASWLIALIPLSMNATGVAIGNGQYAILLMPLLITVLLLAKTTRHSWSTDTLITTLFLLALVKPTFTAPFFLILLLVFPRYRVAIACIIGYALLTLFSSAFQSQDVISLSGAWLRQAVQMSDYAATNLDYGSVHSLLSVLGLSQWNGMASGLLLFILSIWIYRVRHVDLWLIFGVTALVARVWTYHGLYDDMLIMIPIIAVYRLLQQETAESSARTHLLLLLSASIFVMLLPVRLYHWWEAPWPFLYGFSHIFTWIWMAGCLVMAANRQIKSPGNGPEPSADRCAAESPDRRHPQAQGAAIG